MQKFKIFLLISFTFLSTILLQGCSENSKIVQAPTSSTPSETLPLAKPSETIKLENGDSYDLTAEYVNQNIDGKTYKMLAYNGSIPGPILQIPQGSEITVNFTNQTAIPTSIHSHGVRLEDKFDGIVGTHQPAVQQGQSFTYKIKFPDAGIFWYHPHLNEPYSQSHGLYGAYLVIPEDKNYWSPVNQEIPLILNDLSIENGQMESFNPKVTPFALMGQFGNTMFVNGSTNYQQNFQAGEIVRFYIANASNTRTYNLSIPNTKIKLVGGDNGKYEYETWQDQLILSPSERAIIEVFFENPGTYNLQSTNPQATYNLATFTVSSQKIAESFAEEFQILRENKDVIADIDKFRDAFEKEADKNITLTMDMNGMGNMDHGSHMMPDGQMMMNNEMNNEMMEEDSRSSDSSKEYEGIEWEDDMAMMNAMSTTETVRWKMVDDATKKENMNIDWKFKTGDQVKVKIFNDPNSMHPMQHPIHFHGQRFLVLSTDGVKNQNLVWKDTVLVPKGATVEILIDMSNPGKWMAHCHISEHLASDMMLPFEVQ